MSHANNTPRVLKHLLTNTLRLWENTLPNQVQNCAQLVEYISQYHLKEEGVQPENQQDEQIEPHEVIEIDDDSTDS